MHCVCSKMYYSLGLVGVLLDVVHICMIAVVVAIVFVQVYVILVCSFLFRA